VFFFSEFSMQEIHKGILLCSLLCLYLFSLAQDTPKQKGDSDWAREMIRETESKMDREKVLASIGEGEVEDGLWIEGGPYQGDLLAFEAIPQGPHIELVWTTSNEWNTDYFALERLQADQQYATISILPASGNTNQMVTYRFLDERVKDGANTYRLQQVDKNGLKRSCQPITAILEEDGFLTMTPSSNMNRLDIQTDIKMVRISITDQKGQVMVKTEKEVDSFARIEIDKLQPGTYSVKVEDGDQIRVMEFEKKK
jgi:hypothetical protein